MIDFFLASKFGQTSTLAFTTSSGAATKLILQVLKPVLFVLRTTADVHVLQGDSAIVVAATNFLLVQEAYWPILVEADEDAYIALQGDTAAGVLSVTTITELSTVPFL